MKLKAMAAVILLLPSIAFGQIYGEAYKTQEDERFPKIEPLNQTRVWNMGHQKGLIDALWRRHMGEQIRGDERDIATLQRFIDERLYDKDDHQQLLGMGFILGDIWVKKYGFEWKTYIDQKGKSSAVCIDDTPACLFAATMISRRIEGGAEVDVRQIFDRATKSLEPLLPKTY